MWRFILVVSLLCWGSEGSVTCRDNNNGAVDWFILYKVPRLEPHTPTGLEYLYIDSNSNGVTTMVPPKPTASPGWPPGPSDPTNKLINHPNGVLANTLRPLFTPIRSMPQDFGFISYSDQPPGCHASDSFGHSKGVLMVTKTGTGVWLLHSTPQFPFRRDQNHFWPNSGARNAQMFICVTFPYDQFRHIGSHLQYIRAFPFEHDVPLDFHHELRDAVNWAQLPPPNNMRLLRSSGNKAFHSIAKQESDQPRVGDLYVTIAQEVDSDLDVQTWGCQAGRKPSYCVHGIHKVFNIKTVKTDLGDWESTRDHSKWCVAKSQNNHWTCIADVNRAETQYKRRGGALCIQDEKIKRVFLQFAGGTEDCSTQNIINTGCDADSDTHMTDIVPDPSRMG